MKRWNLALEACMKHWSRSAACCQECRRPAIGCRQTCYAYWCKRRRSSSAACCQRWNAGGQRVGCRQRRRQTCYVYGTVSINILCLLSQLLCSREQGADRDDLRAVEERPGTWRRRSRSCPHILPSPSHTQTCTNMGAARLAKPSSIRHSLPRHTHAKPATFARAPAPSARGTKQFFLKRNNLWVQ